MLIRVFPFIIGIERDLPRGETMWRADDPNDARRVQDERPRKRFEAV
jgi:hypothetical protein